MTDIGNVKVVDHPLVQHKLSLMRKKETPTQMFRSLLGEVSRLLCYEVTRNLELMKVSIETPLAPMQAPMLSAEQLVLVSVLRAGNGLLDGMLDLVPTAKVAHIGLYRDPKTLEPVEYYYKVPEKLNDSCVIIVDPMLATGNSAVAAANKLKESGASELHFLCLLAAQEGVDRFSSAHPNVPITTAAIDDRLNSKGYIVPGLGDAGDRMYGTS